MYFRDLTKNIVEYKFKSNVIKFKHINDRKLSILVETIYNSHDKLEKL